MTNHKWTGYALVILQKDSNALHNKVLLSKRSKNQKFLPEHFGLIGGRVEETETPRQTIVREAFEEIGITINPNDLKFRHVFYRQGTENEFVAFVFECDKWQGEVHNKEPEKYSDLLWTELNNLPENIMPVHRSVLNHVEKQTCYSEQSDF